MISDIRGLVSGACRGKAHMPRFKPTTMQVEEVLTYYSMLRRKPLGKAHLQICTNISCMLRGGEELLAGLSDRLGVRPGETTLDGRITLEFAECLGACEGAPCVLVNDECHMNVTESLAAELIENN